MSFDVKDCHDLIRVLEEHPEWKAELRSVLLSGDLLRLPDIVSELAEAQKRTEARLDSLAQKVTELTEAQKRTEAAVKDLTEAQKRTEAAVKDLAEAQKRTEARIGELIVAQLRTDETIRKILDDLGWLKGDAMERSYREKAGSYFGRILRGIRVVAVNSMENVLEQRLTASEMDDLLLLDLLLTGSPKGTPDTSDIWLAIEVSFVIDENDIARAQRRTALLRKAGLPAIPVVAGRDITQAAASAAGAIPVAVFQDGKIQNWEQTLSKRAEAL